jgi:hypothetical protein
MPYQWLWVFLATFSVLGVSCKRQKTDNTSRIKTLDSIASGVLNIDAYQCKGSSNSAIPDSHIIFDKLDPTPPSSQAKTELRQAVKDYLSALPPSAEALFIRLGGRIMISNRSSELCQNAHFGSPLDASQGEAVDGCFNFVSDPRGKSKPIFTIVQSANAKKIRYYGPQIFGYLYAQFYSRLAIAKDGKRLEIAPEEAMSVVGHKERVANAFLRDVLAIQDFKFDALQNLLGPNAAAELRKDGSSEPLERLSTMKDKRRRAQFTDYVYANSFQSAHCNSLSLQVAKTKFKYSSELFADVDAAVIDISTQLTGGQSQRKQPAKGKTDGFSLEGGGLLSAIMPLFGKLTSLIGTIGGAAGGGLASLFGFLLNGDMSGSMPTNDTTIGEDSAAEESFGELYSDLSSSGCEESNCGDVSGDNCSGGSCSNTDNGSCGETSGSCTTTT